MNDDTFFAGIIVGAILSGMIIGFMVNGVTNSVWRADAVRNNVGEYNQKSGEFQWKTNNLYEKH